MEKYLQNKVVVTIFVSLMGLFCGVLGSLTKHKLRTVSSETTVDILFQDNSRIVGAPVHVLPKQEVKLQEKAVGLPKVFAPSAREELFLEIAEKRRIEEERICAEESKIWEDYYLLRPRTIEVNITKFGGSWDRVVTKNERGSVGRNRLRSLNDSKDLYIAWPMPSVSDRSSTSPLDIPSVEYHFGAQFSSYSKKIEAANKALKDYVCEITYINESGEKKIAIARIEDRGPRVATRFDASRAVWRTLGIEDKLKNPNSDSHKVTLGIRLIPKEGIQSDGIEEEELLSSSSGGAKPFKTGASSSKIAGKEFQLPSWDEEETSLDSIGGLAVLWPGQAVTHQTPESTSYVSVTR